MSNKDHFSSKYLGMKSKVEKRVDMNKHTKKSGAISHQTTAAITSKSIVLKKGK